MGAEIAISQDIGSRDEDGRVNGIVNPILSRNSDMSSVRVRGIQTNLEVGCPSKRYFDDEVKKYSYMWRDGGQFSTDKYKFSDE